MRHRLAAALVASLLLAPVALAHESFDEARGQLDAALVLAPRDALLWHRSALLERSRGDLARAQSDLERACALGLEPALAERERGLLARARGSLVDSERHLRRARALAPEDVEAVVAHAEVLGALGRWGASAQAHGRAIALAPRADPDLYLAWARALAAAETPAAALRAIDEAIARLGPVPALVQEGIALELHAGRPDAALARLDRLRGAGGRQERWLVQRGEILERAGRLPEASRDYAAALASLDTLPPGRRATLASLALATRARDGISRVAGSARDAP
jgi:tetratricopeptide (TPR) repeat protein